MATTPRIERQQEVLTATRALLRHWNGPPEVSVSAPLPPDLQQAAAALADVPAADLLRLVAANRATLGGFLR